MFILSYTFHIHRHLFMNENVFNAKYIEKMQVKKCNTFERKTLQPEKRNIYPQHQSLWFDL